MSELFDRVNEMTTTENGALTFNTSGSDVLNLFSMGGSLRNRNEEDIVRLVTKAFEENPVQTVETLLYLRDIRGGQGERRTFYVGMNTIRKNFNTGALIEAIVEVGSWKDVFTMFSVGEYAPYIKDICLSHMKEDKYDLMEKWMPSIGGGKNKEAETLASYLGLTPKQYRKYLSKARASLNIVETKMCSNEWSTINYEHVPSKAGLIHGPAFMRHDTERRLQYLHDANKADGSVNMNTGTLYPYEITGKYLNNQWGSINPDLHLEATWKNLPNYCNGDNALVVADTSGSMYGQPFNVATSLAIYFAEHNTGIFHNEYITFSSKPSFIKFKDNNTLADKLNTMLDNSIVDNTNLQATFDLILNTAVRNNISESEMPKTVVICSDMEFDSATSYRFYGHKEETNFEVIKRKYTEAGYTMPQIVFWNVDSRQNNVPCRYNEQGIVLVSGCSASTFSMIIEGKTNPYDFMLSVIETPRYKELANKIISK